MEKLEVYQLGEGPADFCDVMDTKGKHLACICSLSHEDAEAEDIKEECVIWDKGGYPDIYVKEDLVIFRVVKKGLKLLEKDPRNKHKYELKNG